MQYAEPVFRPPSESESLILQVTLGCSHNACTFCAMYRTKRFAVRALSEVCGEIREAGRRWPGVKRVFLGDGDALAAPAGFLADVLRALGEAFPGLRRVTAYASPQNLLEKTPEELTALREGGLSMFYLGFESGDDEVLKAVNKGVTAEETVAAVLKGHAAGMRSSLMVLLGLGGRDRSEAHARRSAEALNRIQPHHLSCLTWYPVPEAPLYRQIERGAFTLPDDEGILTELGWLLSDLKLTDTVFRANHASNPLPLAGRMNRDRDALLSAVEAARSGHLPLVPAFLRGT